MIRIFVGSDERMGKAELALEHSIRVRTQAEVEFTWMRSGDPGWDDWNIGRERGHPYSSNGWATDFTCFRFAVPNLCDFEGHAIYLDADMIVLGDIEELWDMRRPGRVVTTKRPDVMVWDCAAVAGRWPAPEIMKASGAMYTQYMLMIGDDRLDSSIPSIWNSVDRYTADARLVHYSDMRTQPWKPWPEAFPYEALHRDPYAVTLFWNTYEEAVACASR